VTDQILTKNDQLLEQIVRWIMERLRLEVRSLGSAVAEALNERIAR
jgi:hypothetical protein